MILVYTGKGKGKTSACVGQAVRALGAGLRVGFVQFMKRDGQAGEQRILADLLGGRFAALGAGFYRNSADFPRHREAALTALAKACALMPAPADELAAPADELAAPADLLVLDEILYALNAGLVTREEVEGLCAAAQSSGCHLILSGRGLPPWLADRADLVTEMTEVKHHAARGVKAQAGIEY